MNSLNYFIYYIKMNREDIFGGKAKSDLLGDRIVTQKFISLLFFLI